MLYLIIILVSMALISSANIIFNDTYEWYFYIIFVVGLVVASIIIDGLVALVIRKMPEKWFDYKMKKFNASKSEYKFYKLIGVKKWKDKVLELGMFTNFSKSKIESPKDPEYLRRYILEACYGVIIHYVSFPFAFLILLLDFKMYSGESNIWLTVCLPVAIVNAILIVLPAFVLKYNLGKLIRLYEISARKAL